MDLVSLNGLGTNKNDAYYIAVGKLFKQVFDAIETYRQKVWYNAFLSWNNAKYAVRGSAYWKNNDGLESIPSDKYPNGMIIYDEFTSALRMIIKGWDKIQFTTDQRKDIDDLIQWLLFRSPVIDLNKLLTETNGILTVLAKYGLKQSDLAGLGITVDDITKAGSIYNGENTSADTKPFDPYAVMSAIQGDPVEASIRAFLGDYAEPAIYVYRAYKYIADQWNWFSGSSMSNIAMRSALGAYFGVQGFMVIQAKKVLLAELNKLGYSRATETGTPPPIDPTDPNYKPPNPPVPPVSASFDWVGRSVVAGKTGSYAGIHTDLAKVYAAGIKTGSKIKITSAGWPEANGKTLKVISFDHPGQTMILDIPEPANGAVSGTWEEVKNTGFDMAGIGTFVGIGIAALILGGLFAGKGKAKKMAEHNESIYKAEAKRQGKKALSGTGKKVGSRQSAVGKKKRKSKNRTSKIVHRKSLSGLNDIINKPDLTLE